MAAGYSLNPLYKKLGIKEGFVIKLVSAPKHYNSLIEEIIDHVSVKNTAKKDIDLIHFFTNSVNELEQKLAQLKHEIKKNGIIWISWYKKSSKKPSELDDNIIRDIVLAVGLVDVKVCAVDEDWSGMKAVYRLKDR